jgi:hypothetical protein
MDGRPLVPLRFSGVKRHAAAIDGGLGTPHFQSAKRQQERKKSDP